MSVRPVLLHVDGVVALGKDGRVVVRVLDVHVDEHAGGEDGGALVDGLHLEHWGKYDQLNNIWKFVWGSRLVFGQEVREDRAGWMDGQAANLGNRQMAAVLIPGTQLSWCAPH